MTDLEIQDEIRRRQETTRRQLVDQIIASREEIIRAFIAKTGLDPEDIVQVVQGNRWWLEKRAK